MNYKLGCIKQNYFVLTGAMGTGKSTILAELRKLNLTTVNEPAREIIAEQRQIDGEGIYDRNPNMFYNLMLSRSIYQFTLNASTKDTIIYDRGIADNIAYGNLFKINSRAAQNAAKYYRYNPTVFFLPAWREIYVNDEERKMSFEDAEAFGKQIRKIYVHLGYQLIEVPFDKPQMRAKYILENISDNKNST